MKAYVYETFEQLGRIPANIVIPVGNGTLFIGAVKALEHLHASGAIERFPNIIALQSEKCDPLYRAREAGLEDPARVTPAPTMAEGIAIGVPMRGREILDMMKRHDIRVVHAPEDRILEARALLARRGIYCEHTTAANYAAWGRYCELYGPTPDTLITMCGAGIKSDHCPARPAVAAPCPSGNRNAHPPPSPSSLRPPPAFPSCFLMPRTPPSSADGEHVPRVF